MNQPKDEELCGGSRVRVQGPRSGPRDITRSLTNEILCLSVPPGRGLWGPEWPRHEGETANRTNTKPNKTVAMCAVLLFCE